MRVSDAVPSLPARLFAWGGAGIFCASLLYFLFSYAVTFGEIRPGRLTGGAILADVALFSIFAVHHSVFARTPVRAWMARLVPPYLERAAYVWIASALFIAVCAGWQYVQGVVWFVDGGWVWGLRALQVAGVVVTIRAAAMIDVFELAGTRQLETPVASPEPPVFKTTWPYGWVRHPIYAGWFLIVWPVPLMTMTRLVFAAASTVYLLIAIPLEERSLRATTGGAYDAYARAVRWRIVPFVH
ncbi:MAG TPA: isoprenylcysteine carboxylmethyltransferase family protein [Vicinamibacterales bacterium]|nr:isoprenylcysteine carboxylmethyltransferase family protein [Vicinamibacterales bacterium]